MKMKKFLSSLTAGVMAATTILTSALVTPMMSLAATAADDAPIAFLHIQSSDGKWSLNNYKVGMGTDVTIDKSGSYEVSVKRGNWGDALSSYNFFDLCVQDPDLYDGKSLYKKITIDSVKIGETTHEINQEYTTFTPASMQAADNDDDWSFTCSKLEINPTGWDMPAAGEVISVSFTVELANETTTTTTTTVPVATETTTTTTNETTAETSVETTAASSATTAATTVTTAEEKGVKKITVGKTYSELLKDAQKADPKEGMIGWKWADFGITNSNVVKKVVVNVSSDKEIGTYNYMFGSSTQKAPDYWTQTTQENKTLGKSGEFTQMMQRSLRLLQPL